MAFAFDNESVEIIDIANGEKIPNEIISALQDENIIKVAYNASFERIMLSKNLGISLSPVSWQCTAVQAAMLALPMSLDGVGQVLGLEQQKMKEGKDLIRYFCIPCKPTKTNGERTRNFPDHAPEKWQIFKDYCKRDVEVERSIRAKIAKYPISQNEQELYILDQQINDRGIYVDMELVKNAIACNKLKRMKTLAKAQMLTGLIIQIVYHSLRNGYGKWC